jgi:hypothetical protein
MGARPAGEVTLRPLKYRYERTEDGRKATDTTGRPIIVERLEKGVDVLCALALILEAGTTRMEVVRRYLPWSESWRGDSNP